MNIFYSVNLDNIAKVGVSLFSFFLNNPKPKTKVFLLAKDLEPEDFIKFQDLCAHYDSELFVLDMEPLLKILSSLKLMKNIDHQAYAMLFLCSLVPFENKILYLKDSTLITGNLDKLWDTDIKNYLYAGVADCLNHRYLENVGLRKTDHYIESGVILFNLKLMKELRMEETYIDYMHANNFLRFHEKDVLNGATPNNLVRLVEPIYNAYSSIFYLSRNQVIKANRLKYYPIDGYDYRNAKLHPRIINFNESVVSDRRPWEIKCKHPKVVWYREYKKLSPWFEFPLVKDERSFNRKFVNRIVSFFPKFFILPTVGHYRGYYYPMRDRKRILKSKNVRFAGKIYE